MVPLSGEPRPYPYRIPKDNQVYRMCMSEEPTSPPHIRSHQLRQLVFKKSVFSQLNLLNGSSSLLS